MKLLLSILLAFGISSAYAKELNSFTEIYSSVEQGKNIKMVINFDNCNPKPPVSDISAFTTPTSIMMRKTYLQFSNSPLTTNNPKFLQKPIIENCTYKVTDKDEMSIVTRIITLPDYAMVSETISVCPLKTAVKVFN